MNSRNSRIFCGGSISEVLREIVQVIKTAIERESESYILNVNESEYVTHLVSAHTIEIPEIHFDQVYADSYEKNVPAERFPNRFDVNPGSSYMREVIQFIVPCSGNVTLLNYGPASSFTMGGGEIFR